MKPTDNKLDKPMVFPLYHLPMNPFYRKVVYPGITYQGLSWGYHSLYPSVGELTSCIHTNHQREWSFYREPGMERRLRH